MVIHTSEHPVKDSILVRSELLGSYAEVLSPNANIEQAKESQRQYLIDDMLLYLDDNKHKFTPHQTEFLKHICPKD